jgi:predicted alpha/beta-fold hydrolase
MTMWGKFFRRRAVLDARIERLDTPDGDHLTLVRVDGAGDDAPLLVLLHGLEGTVNSHYANAILAHAAAEGWSALLMCFRTCDGVMNRARRTYHSGETTDLEFVTRGLVEAAPGRPIGLAGVSLGGNVLLKWLGEQGDSIPAEVRGAVAVSTPCDLSGSATRIDRGFSRVYQWNFVRKLRRKALQKLLDFPDVADPGRIATARTFREFDGLFTAPLHGFRDADDYYAKSSSLAFLPHIRRPTLILSSRDDPLLPDSMIADIEFAARENPSLDLELHARGGHVGFVGGPPWRPSYYIERRVVSFLRSCLPQRDPGNAGDGARSTLPAPQS